MTDEPERDSDELAKKALNDETDNHAGPDEPWAKTSSGDKENVTSDDDDA